MKFVATGRLTAAPAVKNVSNIRTAVKKNETHEVWLYIAVTVLVAVTTLVTYWPTLFNFFISDDFSIFIWTNAWFRETQVITPLLQQFYRPWVMNPYHYRPLIGMIWAAEYFLWGANGLFFRLFSIAWMLLTSFIVYLIVTEFGRSSVPKLSQPHSARRSWAILSATIFALYPLHCEPVNWCVCQHDIFATLFYSVSLWCYMRWQRTALRLFLIASLSSMVCGLLCKEVVVTLPLVLSSYDLLCFNNSNHNFKQNNIFTKVRAALAKTLPHWLILFTYFCLRKIILGKFTGSLPVAYYTGTLDMFRTWLFSVERIFTPIDISIITKGNIIGIIWQILVFFASALSFYAFKICNRRLGLFLLVWFIVSLAPAYLLFIISPNLAGARFAYLATVPLSMLLTYGIAHFSFEFKIAPLARILGAALLLLSSVVLYNNNLSWAVAGHLSNKIISELHKYYDLVPDDPQVRILGFPTVGNITGMTKIPFQKRNIYNCDVLSANIINAGEQSFPFGALRESITKKQNPISFLFWDDKSQSLKPVLIGSTIPKWMKNCQGTKLKSVINVIGDISTKAFWEKGNSLHLVSEKKCCLVINFAGLSCWPTDFIDFRVKTPLSPDSCSQRQFELRFLNDIGPNHSWFEYSSWVVFSAARIIPMGKEQHLIFPLRGIPDWAMGGKCHGLKLFLPQHCDIRILDITLPEANTIMPMLSVLPVVELNQIHNNYIMHYDASHIEDCTQTILEIIGPNKDFEELYSYLPDKQTLPNTPVQGSSGILEIKRSFFPGNGWYKARLRALDKTGKQLRLCSDHFLVSIH